MTGINSNISCTVQYCTVSYLQQVGVEHTERGVTSDLQLNFLSVSQLDSDDVLVHASSVPGGLTSAVDDVHLDCDVLPVGPGHVVQHLLGLSDFVVCQQPLGRLRQPGEEKVDGQQCDDSHGQGHLGPVEVVVGGFRQEFSQQFRDSDSEADERVVGEPGDAWEDSLVEVNHLHQVEIGDKEEPEISGHSDHIAEDEDWAGVGADQGAHMSDTETHQSHQHATSATVVLGHQVEDDCAAKETSCRKISSNMITDQRITDRLT